MAECEHFGLLAQSVVDWARAKREEIEAESRRVIRSSYVEVLSVVSPAQRGEAAKWRENTADRYVDGLDGDGLIDALRAITRVRVAVERVRGESKSRGA